MSADLAQLRADLAYWQLCHNAAPTMTTALELSTAQARFVAAIQAEQSEPPAAQRYAPKPTQPALFAVMHGHAAQGTLFD